MSDEPKKRSWALIGWAALATIVLYSLSMGPAYWIALNSPVSPAIGCDAMYALNALYAPVWDLCSYSPWAWVVIERYQRFWIPPTVL
jgi:hypothetical protein